MDEKNHGLDSTRGKKNELEDLAIETTIHRRKKAAESSLV